MDFEDYKRLTQSLADVTYHLRRHYFAEDSDLPETNGRLITEVNYLLGLIEKMSFGLKLEDGFMELINENNAKLVERMVNNE